MSSSTLHHLSWRAPAWRRPQSLLLVLALAIALLLSCFPPVGPTADAATRPPAGLSVAVAGPTALDVSWKAVAGAPRYRVAFSTRKSMKGAKYKRVTGTTLQLNGLKRAKAYYVKVRVITSGGKALSPYSDAVRATTATSYAAPAGLKVASTGTTTVKLAWSSRGTGIRYRVAYSTSASMASATYKRFTPTSATLTGLRSATTYYVKVRVITSAGKSLSPYSAAVRLTTAGASSAAVKPGSQLRVGTFNVKCFKCSDGKPNERSWWDRRGDVVSDIRSQKLDVLGVQEASQAWLPKVQGGKGQDLSQFEDLRNRLGGSWRLANTHRNNCVRSTTPSKCVYKNQGASQGTRIFYDASRVTLLKQGSKLLPSAAGNDRYLAWAVLRQRSTGKKFFFADAHLEPNQDWQLHVDEATTVAKEVAKQNTDRLPTFVVGDMNAHKNTLNTSGKRDNPVYKVIVSRYGYVDPLGNPSGSTTTTPGATVERRIDTPLSSFNGFQRTPNPNYFGRRPNGTYIDYIFTSKRVRVLEWQNVAHLDAQHAYVGKQASDHNLQRATVILP